jgi:hypothetical protein
LAPAVVRKRKFELRDSLAAAAKLIDYYTPKQDAPGTTVNMVVLPPEMAVDLYRRKLRGELGGEA